MSAPEIAFHVVILLVSGALLFTLDVHIASRLVVLLAYSLYVAGVITATIYGVSR